MCVYGCGPRGADSGVVISAYGYVFVIVVGSVVGSCG